MEIKLFIFLPKEIKDKKKDKIKINSNLGDIVKVLHQSLKKEKSEMLKDPKEIQNILNNLKWIDKKINKHNENLKQCRYLSVYNTFLKLIGKNNPKYEEYEDFTTERAALNNNSIKNNDDNFKNTMKGGQVCVHLQDLMKKHTSQDNQNLQSHRLLQINQGLYICSSNLKQLKRMYLASS